MLKIKNIVFGLDCLMDKDKIGLDWRTISILQRLFEKGAFLGLVTDLSEEQSRRTMRSLGVEEFFDHIVNQELMEKWKHPNPYNLAMMEMNGSRHDTLFVVQTEDKHIGQSNATHVIKYKDKYQVNSPDILEFLKKEVQLV